MAELGVRVGIIGAGAIGAALIDRLLASGSSRPAEIVACEPKEARRAEIGRTFAVVTTARPEDAAACGIVVLAAPPLEIRGILAAIGASLDHRPLLVSFAAAVPLSLLEAALPAAVPVVRVNPNSPSIVGAGYNPVTYSERTQGRDRELAERFLRLLGAGPAVADARMNLYTALTAVGPTYFLPVFDAMITAGVAGGLSHSQALAAAVETARATAEMIARRAETPEQLKLITGLRPLEDAAVRELVGKAIAAAVSRMEAVQGQATA
jgi:pyrroline-5-carboxylate reductase